MKFATKMKTMIDLVLICLLPFDVLAQPADILTDDFITYINRRLSSWTACRNFSENTTLEYLKKMVRSSSHALRASNETPILSHVVKPYESLIPAQFDARQKWPQCADIINLVRNQGYCDTSWALAPASVMSDRLCIESLGKVKFIFSPEDIISCCKECKTGQGFCSGGETSKVWDYWKAKGIVSGEDDRSNEGCKPLQSSPTCTTSCTNSNYKIPYKQDKHFGSLKYRIQQNDVQIQIEIMTHGPVTSQFMLYSDFLAYEEGVYRQLAGEVMGTQVVKILGWGVELGIPYWLCANSWGTEWGKMGGFFKILKGVNLGDIESGILTGRAYSKIFPREFFLNSSSTSSAQLLRVNLLIFVWCLSSIILFYANNYDRNV